MRLFKAHDHRVLLMLLLFGFAAATLHVNMHVQSDQQSCEFCSGHSNPAHAIAPASNLPILEFTTEFAAQILPQLRRSRSFTAYHGRAPPATS